MVGKGGPTRSYSLEEVLTEKQIHHVLKQAIGNNSSYDLICSDVKPAAEGLTGFLGDHIRAVLHVKVKDKVQKVHLFVKRMPVQNKPKADFIDENHYFKREKLMFQLIDEMKGAKGPSPWSAKAYIYTDSLIVMPDLAAEGYTVHPLMETMDLSHVLLTTASLARYHAAFANYETRTYLNRPNKFYEKYEHLLVEPTFQDTPWVRTAAKLTADLLDAFSTKYTSRSVPDLEMNLADLFVDACQSLRVEDTLNVMVHKDLWNNNILFKYDKDQPTNAILIDYQCVRYGPPAFDLMSFLYLTTSRAFRDRNESKIFKYYFEVFTQSLEDATRKRTSLLGYGEKDFFSWCEKSRMFGVFEAIGIYPTVLMDPKSAEEIFDDPNTYMEIIERDRSGPVIEYAKNWPVYKERQLEVSEEFVERYVLRQPRRTQL